MPSPQPASLAEFHWKQVVTFRPGVPRSPSCAEGGKKKKAGGWLPLGTHQLSSSPAASEQRGVTTHEQDGSTTQGWDCTSLPLRPEATPASPGEERTGQCSGTRLGLARHRAGWHRLSTAPSNTNATRQEGAGGRPSPSDSGGRKSEGTEVLQEPPTSSNWPRANPSAATTLGSPGICSADHRGDHVQRC